MDKVELWKAFLFFLAGVAGGFSAAVAGTLVEVLRARFDPKRWEGIRRRTFRENVRQALS